MEIIWAKKVLTVSGWQENARIEIDDDGHILSIEPGSPAEGTKVGILLAAPVNLHSHAFQRAMAGMSEQRGPVGPGGHDNFWTWRNLMFRFVDQITPEDNAAIAAFVQMEMLEAGYASVCEFHYLHHQPGGEPYNDIAQMGISITDAASESGIGLTLLPVLYQHGGCDGRPLTTGQSRFGNSPDQFAALYESSKNAVGKLPADCTIGVAPHSLRAVTRAGLEAAISIDNNQPVHMHIAEQVAEIEEIKNHWGQTPVEWLLDHHQVNQRWCLIHSTHMSEEETKRLARSGAVAGLCPITESSLGDGIFNGEHYLASGGRIGIGSDSNITISLSQEMRTLEYSQRLRHLTRAVLATSQKSTGRRIFDCILEGGAQAAARKSGAIEPGKLADLVALYDDATDLYLKDDDMILDSFIFAGNDKCISDVWSAGRHMVQRGQHIANEEIVRNYKNTIASLKDRI